MLFGDESKLDVSFKVQTVDGHVICSKESAATNKTLTHSCKQHLHKVLTQ